MAYDIEGIVNPAEIVTLKSLNTEINESTTALIKFLELQAKYKTSVDNVAGSNTNATQKINEYSKIINKASDEQNKLTTLAKEHQKIQQQLVITEAKLFASKSEANKQLIENRAELQKQNQAIKDNIKANEASEGSLVRMRLKLKDLTDAYDKSGVRTKAAAKEIDSLSREIGKAEAATNRHQRGVGGYADQLGQLPGFLGRAASGAAGLGKQLWALVANPIVAIVAALVVGLGLLFKAFKSTDDGATTFAGVLKAIGNVINVLMDRLVSFGKLLWDIATFDFKGIKENAVDTFGGITKAIGEAATAGMNYAKVLDSIEDREAASAVRAAKLRKEIQELTVASTNEALGSKEQIRLKELAMQKAIELNSIEKGFLTEKTKNEADNLASMIEGDNLTIKSKQELLNKWLLIDDTMLESAMENDKEFANFYNKNATAFQALQKMKADEIDKETELVTETRRLQKGLFTEKEQLRKDEESKIKESNEKKKEQSKLEIELGKQVTESTKKQIAEDEKLIEEDFKNFLAISDAEMEQVNKDFEEKKQIGELEVQAAIRDRQRQYEAEKMLIESTAGNETEARRQIFDLNKKYIADDIALVRDQMNIAGLSAEQQIELSNQLKDLELENQQLVADNDKKLHDEKLARQKELVDGLIQLGSKIFEFSIANTNAELSALEEKNKKGIISEEEFNKKKAELEIKKAKQERTKALFEIAVNTATSIIKTLSQFGIPAALPFMAIAAALGGIQAGIVLKEPLPKYWTGTKNAKEVGIVGDRGRELATLTTGENVMFDKPTLYAGKKFKGMHVRTNAETERIMSATEHTGFGAVSFSDSKLLEKLDSVERAIKNKKEWIVDDEYKVIGYQQSNQRNIYLNRLKYGK